MLARRPLYPVFRWRCFEPGAPLWEILAAGDWKSPAFLDYLDKFRLERDVVMQAHLDESEVEDEE